MLSPKIRKFPWKGELGYLRGESRIQKEEIIKIKPEDLTKPEEGAEFAEKTHF